MTYRSHHEAAKAISRDLDKANYFNDEIEGDGDGKSSHLYGCRDLGSYEAGLSVDFVRSRSKGGLFEVDDDATDGDSAIHLVFTGSPDDERVSIVMHVDGEITRGPVDLCLDLYLRRDTSDYPTASQILARMQQVEAAAQVFLAGLSSSR